MSRKSAVLALAAALAVGGTSIAAAGDDDHDGRAIRLTAKNAGLSIVENGQPMIAYSFEAARQRRS